MARRPPGATLPALCATQITSWGIVYLAVAALAVQLGGYPRLFALPAEVSLPAAGLWALSSPGSPDENPVRERPLPTYGPAVSDEDGYFGEHIAATYDDPSSDTFQPDTIDPAVRFLAELAGAGRALELGVGTGRIALPLAARGVPVHGIDLSRAMVARLRAKPGGDAIGVSIGDFATTKVDGTFAVAYLVFNTIMNLTTQEAQVACFRNVAAHLEPGGCFVIEVMVPELRKLPPGQHAVPFHVGPTRLGFDTYDVATQAMSSHHIKIVDGHGEYTDIPFRYVWPAELDLMAQLAGLRLRERWEGWAREPFTHDSGTHVSVWEKPAD